MFLHDYVFFFVDLTQTSFIYLFDGIYETGWDFFSHVYFWKISLPYPFDISEII